MVMFTKNGQGYFDFDYETLKELTIPEFADRVKSDLERSYIQCVDFENTQNYVHVYIVTIGTCVQYTFVKEKQTIMHDVLTHNAVEKFNAMLKGEVK